MIPLPRCNVTVPPGDGAVVASLTWKVLGIMVIRQRRLPLDGFVTPGPWTVLPGHSPGRYVVHEAIEQAIGKIEYALLWDGNNRLLIGRAADMYRALNHAADALETAIVALDGWSDTRLTETLDELVALTLELQPVCPLEGPRKPPGYDE